MSCDAPSIARCAVHVLQYANVRAPRLTCARALRSYAIRRQARPARAAPRARSCWDRTRCVRRVRDDRHGARRAEQRRRSVAGKSPDPAMRSIPIIAVTSYALSGEEKKARAAGPLIRCAGGTMTVSVVQVALRLRDPAIAHHPPMPRERHSVPTLARRPV